MAASAEPVTAYARAAAGGKVPCGRLVRLAAERHLRDLKDGKKRGLRFDPVAAARVTAFFTNLRHSKGEWAGQAFSLSPWQAFIAGSLFGWRGPEGTRRFRIAYTEVPRKNGKALAVDTPVLTIDGWKPHGTLVAGDTIFAPDGRRIRVLAVAPAHLGPTMRVVLSDGSSVQAHERHEWVTERTWYTGRRRGSRARPLPPVETSRLAATLREPGRRRALVHRIPVAQPLDCETRALPIPPYTLGAWLGDGTSASASITSADEYVTATIAAEGFQVKPRATRYRFGIGGLQVLLRRAGLLNNKHIPPEYLISSKLQRLALLRGLIDTDGHVTRRGQIEYVSVSVRLAHDVVLLARTLGLKPTLTEDRARLDGKDCGPRYRIQFWTRGDSIVGLARKEERLRPSTGRALRRQVVAVEPAGDALVNCIEVEGGLYLAGEGLVTTHNSTFSAGLAIILAFFDGEPGAEVYCAATKREQARIVFDEAKRMVERTPGLKRRIDPLAGSLSQPSTASKLQPLSADHDTMDGLNMHGGIIDELHAHKTSGIVDVLETATGARRQPLQFEITTAGYDRNSICWKHHDYTVKVLEGAVSDDTWFGYIAAADPGDDWRSEKTWAKANPNLGISVRLDDLMRKAKKAEHLPAQQNAFRRLHLNEWTEQADRWLDMTIWDACAGAVDEAALRARHADAFAGLDMASVRDLSAFAVLFGPDQEGVYDVVWRFWIPRESLEAGKTSRSEGERRQLEEWAAQGFITVTEGTVTDYDHVERDIFEEAEAVRLIEIAYDRWNVTQLVTHLMDEFGTDEDAIPRMVGFGQGFQSMSAPTKELEKLLLARKLRHGGNPVARWMASNVAVRQDPAGNMKPDRERSAEKIDGIVALVMAIGRSTAHRGDGGGPSVYETRGVLVI